MFHFDFAYLIERDVRLLTNSMKQSPFREPNSHSSSQEIPAFLEPGILLPCWERPATRPCS
jgi:hypothetical protein